MRTNWIDAVAGVPRKVRPVAVDAVGTALVCRFNGTAALRFHPPEEHEGVEAAIAALEDHARAEGLRRVETQGKIGADSPAAHALAARGYATKDAASVVFRVDVAGARRALGALGAQLGGRAPGIESAADRPMDEVAAVVSAERLLDDFELLARLNHEGAGAIRATDSPVMYYEDGVGGVHPNRRDGRSCGA